MLFFRFHISDILEKVMASHSSTVAWKIPWTEKPGRLHSMGSRRVGHDRVTSLSLFIFMHWRRKRQPTPVFLPGESQGWEPGGLPSMGLHRVGHVYIHHLCRFKTFRLLSCLGYCKQCCSECWGTCILLDRVFLQIAVTSNFILLKVSEI